MRRPLLTTLNSEASPDSILTALAAWGPLAVDEALLIGHGQSFAYDACVPWLSELQAVGGDPVVLHRVEVEGFAQARYDVVESVRGQTVTRGTRTAIIQIVGPITPFAVPEWFARYGIRVASLPAIVAAARAAANDPDVGRILLAIHSPGGSVYGVPEAAAALREVGKRKKMVATVNYMAASAGYWLASTASEIVATPSALVGSIGAAIRHVSFARMAEADGVDVTDIAFPASKRDVTEFKPLSETGRVELTRLVEAAYEDFKADISATRRLDFTVNGDQYGRVVTASDALGLKLIDRVASFDTVLGEGPAVDLPTLTRSAASRLAHLKRKSTDA